MSSTAKMRRVPSVFAGAFGSALTAVGVWNFVKAQTHLPGTEVKGHAERF
jgi:hypothetical protein